jgi:DNA-binding transcriptional regulator/RsmH inhibitor MraZ
MRACGLLLIGEEATLEIWVKESWVNTLYERYMSNAIFNNLKVLSKKISNLDRFMN